MKLEELACISENLDIDEYITFREEVKSHMPNPEWLGDFATSDLIVILHNQAKIWVYYLNQEPVCSMMLIPSDEETLRKFNLSFAPTEVVDYGPMFVNPRYVGHGLQLQMLKKLDEYCLKLGYKYALSTIHPDNIYSINNLVKDNFVLINTLELKRGIRNIYLKNLLRK